MPARCAFEYAVVRVVPRVERDEFVNAGVVLFADAAAFLAARIELDEARLLAIAPGADAELARRHLDALARVCEGGPGAGPIGRLSPRERFRWIVAPRSTIVQTSPPHAGLCDDPARALDRLVSELVRAPRP
ncbi:MAG TPA: DUF3037 domain-containing protein [Minicystis sp.]|nr:DUF3037 domain-containing protein [Minicystis sp.]